MQVDDTTALVVNEHGYVQKVCLSCDSDVLISVQSVGTGSFATQYEQVSVDSDFPPQFNHTNRQLPRGTPNYEH